MFRLGAIGGLAVLLRGLVEGRCIQANKVLICIHVNIYRNFPYVLSLTKH